MPLLLIFNDNNKEYFVNPNNLKIWAKILMALNITYFQTYLMSVDPGTLRLFFTSIIGLKQLFSAFFLGF